MGKRISWNNWQKHDVVTLKLKDDLFTLGQMLSRPAMRFYDIRSKDGVWRGIDLNQVKPLFQVFIGRIVLQRLAVSLPDRNYVIPSNLPFERFWIKPKLSPPGGQYPFEGGSLVDLGPDGGIGSTVAPIVKANLSAELDREVIVKYEMTGIWGDDHIRDRLLDYFETAENWDPRKDKVFPGIKHSGPVLE